MKKMKWQTIDTAPKDGTVIIAYQPSGTFFSGHKYPEVVGIASWQEPDDLNPAHWSGPLGPKGHPTHWMPLPSPPRHHE